MNTEDYLRLARPALLHIATNAEELKADAARAYWRANSGADNRSRRSHSAAAD